MSAIAQALAQEGITSQKLPFDDFQSWFFQLETQSASASEKDVKELVNTSLSSSSCVAYHILL